MFGNSIQELFGSLSVGLIFCFFSLYILYYLKNTIYCEQYDRKNLIEYYSDKFKDFNSTNTALSLFLFIFIYAVGIVIEDVTDHLTDSDESKMWHLSNIECLLGSEEEYRCKVLVKNETDKCKGDFIFRERTDLGKLVFSNATLIQDVYAKYVRSKPSDSFKVQDHLDTCGQPHDEELSELINHLYFKAKNWCYAQDNHFQELELIQNRIDFSRSTAILSIFFMTLIVLLSGFQSVRFCIASNLSKKISKEENGNEELLSHYSSQRDTILWLLKKNLLTLIFLIGILLLSITSYAITEQNFNDRAFGYYFSYIDEKCIEK